MESQVLHAKTVTITHVIILIPFVPLTTVLPFCCSLGTCSGDWTTPLSSTVAGSVVEAILSVTWYCFGCPEVYDYSSVYVLYISRELEWLLQCTMQDLSDDLSESLSPKPSSFPPSPSSQSQIVHVEVCQNIERCFHCYVVAAACAWGGTFGPNINNYYSLGFLVQQLKLAWLTLLMVHIMHHRSCIYTLYRTRWFMGESNIWRICLWEAIIGEFYIGDSNYHIFLLEFLRLEQWRYGHVHIVINNYWQIS